MTDSASLPGWAQRIRLARNWAGLSQQAVADALKYGQSAIGSWEHAIAQPDLEVFDKLAALFDCDATWLTHCKGRGPPGHRNAKPDKHVSSAA